MNIYFTRFLQLLPGFFVKYLLLFNVLVLILWFFRDD